MSRKAPFFSIVLPLRPPKDRFQRTLNSVLRQTEGDWQLIVVEEGNGGGAKLPKEKRIRRVSSKGSGLSSARNTGVAAAKGPYVAFLDCGDEWEPGYLSTLKGLIHDFPGAGLYGTNYWIHDGKDKWENRLRLPRGWRGRKRYFFDWMYYGRPPFCASSVALPLSAARANPFVTGLKAGEDILVWFRVALKQDAAYLKQPLATYDLGKPEGKGVYFGPLNHFDWLALGMRLKREGQLPAEAEKFTVWATLIQVRKMIANGWRDQARTLFRRCPKTRFPFYTAYVAGLLFFPQGLWKMLQPGVKSARWFLTGGFFGSRNIKE